MTFAEVGVRFSSRYHHIIILASQSFGNTVAELSGSLRQA